VTDDQLVAKLRANGILIPRIAAGEAHAAHLEVAVLAAVLEQETGGGRNVFGHDPTIFRGAGAVTKAKYLAYKTQRDKGGKGKGGMQGVGPMQLTYYSYQDEADLLGGCWIPRCNVRVGARSLADAIRRNGLYAALKAYNGSDAYARQVMARVDRWRKLLK
jgi:hypothetical protein